MKLAGKITATALIIMLAVAALVIWQEPARTPDLEPAAARALISACRESAADCAKLCAPQSEASRVMWAFRRSSLPKCIKMTGPSSFVNTCANDIALRRVAHLSIGGADVSIAPCDALTVPRNASIELDCPPDETCRLEGIASGDQFAFTHPMPK